LQTLDFAVLDLPDAGWPPGGVIECTLGLVDRRLDGGEDLATLKAELFSKIGAPDDLRRLAC